MGETQVLESFQSLSLKVFQPVIGQFIRRSSKKKLVHIQKKDNLTSILKTLINRYELMFFYSKKHLILHDYTQCVGAAPGGGVRNQRNKTTLNISTYLPNIQICVPNLILHEISEFFQIS